jgi:hypothetical protein
MVLSDQCNFYRHFGGAKQTKNHRPGTVAFMVLMSLKPSGLITWRLIGVVDLAAPMQIVAKSWIWPLDKLQKNMLPSGYDQHSHGKSPFVIGKPSINGPFSPAMLNNQRVYIYTIQCYSGDAHGPCSTGSTDWLFSCFDWEP